MSDKPEIYVCAIPHPHCSLCSYVCKSASVISQQLINKDAISPFFPFLSLNDFKITCSHILKGNSKADINEDLKWLHDGTLAKETPISFKNAKDMYQTINKAVTIYTQICYKT